MIFFRSLFLLAILIPISISAQDITQNLRGSVVDADTKIPLIGCTVKVLDISEKLFGAAVNASGDYAIRNIPIGKHEVEYSFVGYNPVIRTVILTSGKEYILNIELEESALIGGEVEVVGTKKGEVINEMATVSSQSFTIEETNRYAGSRGDPARMVSNYAGAQGADDSRNDIVIRGNSPLGVLYKVEGVDIPNPNHFAIAGSTGGPVAILNNKFLSNSDFFMSAFPAEFGNSLSGVFDINLRNGNNSIHEFSGQFGFLGTEFQVEGPLSSKSKASYLIGGRYSTLTLMKQLGVTIGTDAVPLYGDGAFKFNFPLKKGGAVSFFGIGGASSIDIVISDQEKPAQDAFGEQDRDQYFGTQMYFTGMTFTKPINSKTFVKATVAYSKEIQRTNHEYILRDLNPDSTWNYKADPFTMMTYRYEIDKLSAYVGVNRKINSKHLFQYGLNVDAYTFSMQDSIRNVISDSTSAFKLRWDYRSTNPDFLVQAFAQWRYKVNPSLLFTAGLHSQYFTHSNSVSPVEPRIGAKYNLNEKSVLAAGVGMHSQIQPLYTYTYHLIDPNTSEKIYHNRNMDFSRSLHSVLSYSTTIRKTLQFKSEIYYQHLYNIPVEVASSSFSLLNQGSGFARFFPDSLQNTGTGQNYGIEFTVQKFFNKSFFFMTTLSLYESKYRGSDGVLRDTDFNGNYIVNGLIGKELTIGKKKNQLLGFGAKVTYAGGRRYGFVDTIATNALEEIVFLDDGYNTRRLPEYFRFDFKVNYTLNAAKVSHEFGLDLVNVFNTRNILGLTYVPNEENPGEPFQFRNQLGRLPLFYYKIEFRLNKRSKGLQE
ncbi:MAG: carboxypeptidase-like regulatory domain-containing protein [Crocinitomicaceae bacterium]